MEGKSNEHVTASKACAMLGISHRKGKMIVVLRQLGLKPVDFGGGEIRTRAKYKLADVQDLANTLREKKAKQQPKQPELALRPPHQNAEAGSLLNLVIEVAEIKESVSHLHGAALNTINALHGQTIARIGQVRAELVANQLDMGHALEKIAANQNALSSRLDEISGAISKLLTAWEIK